MSNCFQLRQIMWLLQQSIPCQSSWLLLYDHLYCNIKPALMQSGILHLARLLTSPRKPTAHTCTASIPAIAVHLSPFAAVIINCCYSMSQKQQCLARWTRSHSATAPSHAAAMPTPWWMAWCASGVTQAACRQAACQRSSSRCLEVRQTSSQTCTGCCGMQAWGL
jgi:hypothetical protein